MASFVLVHGGWHSAWSWRLVAPLLRAAGHDVWAPTLTGLGERAFLVDALRGEVGVSLHVREVAGLLECEDLRDVCLVGHSYAGMVVAGVADVVGSRVGRLVFVDAFVPGDGDSLFSLLRPERRARFEEAVRGWVVPPPPVQAWGVTDPERVAWMEARVTDQPLRCFEEPVRLSRPLDLPCAYVHCTEGPAVASFAGFAAFARSAPGWEYRELATGHDAMETMPEELAEILCELGTHS